jgi:Protein of unknown function (DUF1573)
MRRILFLCLGCTTIIGICSCDIRKQDKLARFPAAKKLAEPPTTVQILDSVIDFGTVNEGDVVERSFRFKNVGNKPLIIAEATASCGCTVPQKPDAPIPPGGIDSIKVKFNSDKKPGQASKTVQITSNANPLFPTLVLKGTVIGKKQ